MRIFSRCVIGTDPGSAALSLSAAGAGQSDNRLTRAKRAAHGSSTTATSGVPTSDIASGITEAFAKGKTTAINMPGREGGFSIHLTFVRIQSGLALGPGLLWQQLTTLRRDSLSTTRAT